VCSKNENNSAKDDANEPSFLVISKEDLDLQTANAHASETMPMFMTHLLRQGDHLCIAKLCFRDPAESDHPGREAFLYLWLVVDSYDFASRRYIGRFFEVPAELREWHSVGQELEFESEDIFDWAVNDAGVIHGGYSMRVNRSRLPVAEQVEFDRRIGATDWAPVAHLGPSPT
jgi:uncharacterized protein YegJ (DUF2314 family)